MRVHVCIGVWGLVPREHMLAVAVMCSFSLLCSAGWLE